MRVLFSSFLCLLLVGCASITTSPQRVAIYYEDPLGIVSFSNHTDVPQAGSRATAMAADILRAKGALTLIPYQNSKNCSQLITCPNAATPIGEMLQWARDSHLRYLMMGSVNEWQYKVGLDGEPVAAVTMELYEVETGAVVWSAVGSKIGASRSGLGNTAQGLIYSMLHQLKIR